MKMTLERTCYADRIGSPLGDLFALVDEKGALVRLDFVDARERAHSEGALERQYARRGVSLRWERARLAHVRRALRRYFAGELERFDLALAPEGTPFQQAVWRALVRVPFGRTISYAELARRVDRPRAARAVGRANATNPIALVVPCHRVVGSAGALTGYAGGLERKRALLELERARY